jgi:AcrR family transcriptional regulator
LLLLSYVEVAERLFRQIGFQKTRVAEIARELHMSPANVYRYFATKSEINEAVCLDILGRIEAEAEKIAASRGTAAQRMNDRFLPRRARAARVKAPTFTWAALGTDPARLHQ